MVTMTTMVPIVASSYATMTVISVGQPKPAEAMIIGIRATHGSEEKRRKSDHWVRPWS
ncbi:hypothetical protein D3C83_272380 [compost metagenome]